MNWGGAAEFFAMGGYAPYVWGSYAVDCALHRRRVARRCARAGAPRSRGSGRSRAPRGRTASEAAA